MNPILGLFLFLMAWPVAMAWPVKYQQCYEGNSMDVSRVLLQLRHYWHDCANWVITFVPEELLFWFAVVAFFIVIGLGLSALFWWLRGKSGHNQERLEAENGKIQELEEKIMILESEKGCVELQAETLQQRLEAQLTLQQTPDSEKNDRESKVKEVIRSHTREMKELKQDLEQTESLFKTEMMFHAQQMEEILMDIRIAEQNLNVEREQSEILRKKKDAEVESERRDKEMEVKALLRSHKLNVHEIEEEHRRAEISYEAEIESLKKESQEIWETSECELTACWKEIDTLHKQLDDVSTEPQLVPFKSTPGLSHQQTTRNETCVVATQTEFSGSSDESVERENHIYLERLLAEQWKTLVLEGKMVALNQDRDALEDQNCKLEQQTSALQGRVQNMTDLCQQKEQTLHYVFNRTLSTFGQRMQRMTVQVPRLAPVTETTGSWSEEDL